MEVFGVVLSVTNLVVKFAVLCPWVAVLNATFQVASMM